MDGLKATLRYYADPENLAVGSNMARAAVKAALARIEALEAEVARLRSLVKRAQLNTPEQYQSWHEDARQALKGPTDD